MVNIAFISLEGTSFQKRKTMQFYFLQEIIMNECIETMLKGITNKQRTNDKQSITSVRIDKSLHTVLFITIIVAIFVIIIITFLLYYLIFS